MNIPVNFFYFLLAFLPIMFLLFLMIKMNIATFKAAPLSLALAIIIGLLFYKGNMFVIINELLKASWSAFAIIAVIFTAILIYEVTNEAGAFSALNATLDKLVPNELIKIIGLSLVFVSFLQGVTGFGVPVAVTAPLLIAIGVRPLYAVVLSLLGHAWAGTFGTLGVAWLALVAESNIDGKVMFQTGMYAAIFLWILNFGYGLAICWFYGRFKAVKKGFVAVLVVSFVQGGGQLYISQTNGILAAFLPACVSIIAFVFLSKIPLYRQSWKLANSKIMDRSGSVNDCEVLSKMKLWETFLPYIFMTAMTLAFLVHPTVKEWLSAVNLSFSFPETKTGYGFVNESVANYGTFSPFAHSSFYLLVSALVGFWYYKKKGYIKNKGINTILLTTLKKLIYPGIAIFSLTMMSKVMVGTGQIYVLAQTFSNLLGKNYLLIAPLVGLFGCFITSSNIASNILFANFQFTMSKMLVLDPATILGGQTAGASIGTSIAPSNITLGAMTANMPNQEGKILKVILPFALAMALLMGIITKVLI